MLLGHAVTNGVEGTKIQNETVTLVLLAFDPEKGKSNRQLTNFVPNIG
jgi:uncharacterized protein YggU (UPF0235/DUF167 family)